MSNPLLADEPRRPADAARLELARLNPGPDLPLADILRRACELSADTLAVARAGIWFYTADRKALRCAYLYEREERTFCEGATLQVADFPDYFQALESRRSIPAEQAHADPRTRQLAGVYLGPLGIASMLDASIYRDGRVIGVLCNEHSGPPREWTTEERDFAASVSDLIALKLNAADLQESQAVLQQTCEMLLGLEQAEVLARVAAGAAHDFKNILTVVIGFATEILRVRTLPKDVLDMAGHILEAGNRGATLVQEMAAFGRAEADAPQVVKLADAVERVLPLVRSAAGPAWHVQFHRDPGVGRVFIDPARLERVVMNLVLNARDAMPSGGILTARVSAEDVNGDAAHHGVYALLAVADTGVGMDEETRARMFEPFFTTKRATAGTGMGMAIVKQIVERAGGFIRVDSAVGLGTTVRVYLPRVTGG
jgi:signal transduction histidine kinase